MRDILMKSRSSEFVSCFTSLRTFVTFILLRVSVLLKLRGLVHFFVHASLTFVFRGKRTPKLKRGYAYFECHDDHRQKVLLKRMTP